MKIATECIALCPPKPIRSDSARWIDRRQSINFQYRGGGSSTWQYAPYERTPFDSRMSPLHALGAFPDFDQIKPGINRLVSEWTCAILGIDRNYSRRVHFSKPCPSKRMAMICLARITRARRRSHGIIKPTAARVYTLYGFLT